MTEAALFALPLLTGVGLVAIAQPDGRRGVCNVTPRLQPPGWVFSVVWPILYLMLGAALVLVWRSKHVPTLIALLGGIIGLQAWWWIFSSACRPAAAFLSLAALAAFFGIFAINQIPNNPRVALLLAPLVAWCSFATYLSYQIWVGDIHDK